MLARIRSRKFRKKPPPEGWEDIQEKILEFENEMREAERETKTNQRKNEMRWKIFQINHKRSRYVFNLYFKKKEISKKLYQFLIDQKFADKGLISYWRKEGYERLCCQMCVQTTNTHSNTTCICRVPKKQRSGKKPIKCHTCGCPGCC
ncbi:protein bud31 [Anaeramoeba flamelloides]|uniref:Protein bud31 n=1 Tax=Anaeramoeba flamelloides TaxID=1746091 RepID=A0ABQ8XGM1_9EUKA|nr:protein bud31 [Anaeramoeba flamelloides]